MTSAARGRKDGESPRKGPDPSEFDPELVIDDKDVPSPLETPRSVIPRDDVTSGKEREEASETNGVEKEDQPGKAESTLPLQELPTDVRVKLRKLEKLEPRYHGRSTTPVSILFVLKQHLELLKSYRVAHARVLSIEPFENSLRENTPLTSIGDPSALVEYLNQINLKGDMVLDELKRVSAERDKFKEELSQAKESTQKALDEAANLRKRVNANVAVEDNSSESNELQQMAEISPSIHADDPLTEPMKSPPTSVKSRTGSLTSLSLFPPRSKPAESPVIPEKREDFFSYDEEIPRLETELKERHHEIEGLRAEVTNLKNDLAVARESTQSMVGTLEESSRELLALRERKERSDVDFEERQIASGRLVDQLKVDLRTAERKIEDLTAEHSTCDPDATDELEQRLEETRCELDRLRVETKLSPNEVEQMEQLKLAVSEMKIKEIDVRGLRDDYQQSEKRLQTLNNLVTTLRGQLSVSEEEKTEVTAQLSREQQVAHDLRDQIAQVDLKVTNLDDGIKAQHLENSQASPNEAPKSTDKGVASTNDAISAAKKKSKKKKKSNKSTASPEKESSSNVEEKQSTRQDNNQEASATSEAVLTQLHEKIESLNSVLNEKEAAIERLHGKLKHQEELCDEIETLRDDLVSLGQEHVEVKDRMKRVLAEKGALGMTIQGLEKELGSLREKNVSSAAEAEQKQKDLTEQFEDLKSKATTLQTDLAAAQLLASSRFKDLTEMRSILQKAQPELIALRNETAESKKIKEALGKKDTELERLNRRQEESRDDMIRLERVVTERNLEIQNLNQKISEETTCRIKAENTSSKITEEVQRLETERRQAMESLDRLSKDLAKSQEDLTSSRARLRDVEQQLSQISRDNEGLKEEIDLKTAQHTSAQNLMGNMRDQTAEMAIQMKEARDRCESLDEEVAEARRLLSERSREGETMRRLLVDVEGRADARVREMKERMDMALEERDRAEDEASLAGRRKARELEELRNRVREAERDLKRAEDDKDELETAQKEWKRRREELEQKSESHAKEVEEVRKAMGELRDALDESERQARELEKQKAEMRKSVEETQQRLEKLQKSHKVRQPRRDESSSFGPSDIVHRI